MSHTQILLIGTAIVFILFALEMLYSHKKGKPLISLQSDDLTFEEREAVERGELKTEKINQNYRWWLFCIIMIPNTANIILHDKIKNCEVVWGLDGYFWQIGIWYTIFLISIIGYVYLALKRYQKSLKIGFMPRFNQKSRTYRVLIKASQSQIHLAFFAKFATVITISLVAFIVLIQTLPPRIKNLGWENLPKTQLQTYQIASQKLQQQCLAEK